MSKFNVGDPVRIVGENSGRWPGMIGTVTTIESASSYGYGLKGIDTGAERWDESELELIIEGEETMGDNQLISAAGDLKTSVLYKLRLNKLDKTSRTLQKNGIINSNGFLTAEGAQVFLDALWQSPNGKLLQKDIAESLAKVSKDEKEEKKSADK